MINRSAPRATIVPILIYEDVGKAVDWLCGAFGFTERLRAARSDGKVSHAQLAVAEGAIMMGAGMAVFAPRVPTRSTNTCSCMSKTSTNTLSRRSSLARGF